MVQALWNSLPERFPKLVLDGYAESFACGAGFWGPSLPCQRRLRRKRQGSHRSLLRLTRQLRTIRSRMWPELSSRFQAFKSSDSAKKSCALVDGENLRNIQQYSLENSLNWALDA